MLSPTDRTKIADLARRLDGIDPAAVDRLLSAFVDEATTKATTLGLRLKAGTPQQQIAQLAAHLHDLATRDPAQLADVLAQIGEIVTVPTEAKAPAKAAGRVSAENLVASAGPGLTYRR